MTSAVRIERSGGGTGFLLRFGGGKRATVFAGQAANLENTEGVSGGRMDVQGCCGVHGFASLCGVEEGKYQLLVAICQLLVAIFDRIPTSSVLWG